MVQAHVGPQNSKGFQRINVESLFLFAYNLHTKGFKSFLFYMEMARGQNWDLHTVSGIIIYPYQDEFPQDVVIIPIDLIQGKSLAEMVEIALSNPPSIPMLSYFQNIRWIMPDLNNEVQNRTFIEGKADELMYFYRHRIKFSYGKNSFDRSRLEDMYKRAPSEDEIYVEVLNKRYFIIMKHTTPLAIVHKL